jgi:hypothetical protein
MGRHGYEGASIWGLTSFSEAARGQREDAEGMTNNADRELVPGFG